MGLVSRARLISGGSWGPEWYNGLVFFLSLIPTLSPPFSPPTLPGLHENSVWVGGDRQQACMLMKFVSSSLSKPVPSPRPPPRLSHTQISFQLLSHRPGGHLSLCGLPSLTLPHCFQSPSPHHFPQLGRGALCSPCLPSHLLAWPSLSSERGILRAKVRVCRPDPSFPTSK